MYCFSCIYCVLIHVLYFPACIVCCFCMLFHILHFASCIMFCFMYCILLHSCQVSFWTYIWVFNNLYPKFLCLTNRYPYFPFLLDISCYFLMIMSNFYLAKLFFHLLCSSFWIFPATFLMIMSNFYLAKLFLCLHCP